MSEEKKKQPDSTAGEKEILLKKLQHLEQALDKIEQSRKQKNLISFIGLIMVLLGLLLFFMNLKSYASSKLSDNAFREELISIARQDLKEIASTNEHAAGMRDDVQNIILPYVSEKIIERFKEDAPHLRKTGENFAGEMKDYLNNDVKEKLIKALSESLAEVSGVLEEKYPKMTPEQLKKLLDETHRIFIIRITDIVDTKIGYISDDLGALKSSVDNFKNCKEYKKHDPTNQNTAEYVKKQMVEAMLELIIYHLNEQKGALPVEKSVGGDAK